MGVETWKINVKAREALTRAWLNVNRLQINAARDTVFIKGVLDFVGGKVDASSPIAVTVQLNKVEREIMTIKGVKHVQWKLEGWQKSARNRWEIAAKKAIE